MNDTEQNQKWNVKKEEENYNRKRYSKAHNILYLELEK